MEGPAGVGPLPPELRAHRLFLLFAMKENIEKKKFDLKKIPKILHILTPPDEILTPFWPPTNEDSVTLLPIYCSLFALCYLQQGNG